MPLNTPIITFQTDVLVRVSVTNGAADNKKRARIGDATAVLTVSWSPNRMTLSRVVTPHNGFTPSNGQVAWNGVVIAGGQTVDYDLEMCRNSAGTTPSVTAQVLDANSRIGPPSTSNHVPTTFRVCSNVARKSAGRGPRKAAKRTSRKTKGKAKARTAKKRTAKKRTAKR